MDIAAVAFHCYVGTEAVWKSAIDQYIGQQMTSQFASAKAVHHSDVHQRSWYFILQKRLLKQNLFS